MRRLRIEDVGELGRRFDHIVCTGVLHHLADPLTGLRRLRDVLAPGGAITLMVYARHGRVGVSMLQEYCRRLGVGPSGDDVTDLVATLRELPLGHPFGRLLRETRELADDDALADALCNPRERAYDVTELFDLLAGAGLRFGRWERQAPYLPDCGAISETPHGARIAQLPGPEQYALMELFRGTITRHTAIAFDADDTSSGVLDFAHATTSRWVPVTVPSTIAVEERLPAGAAAALINRAHTDTDLVLFVDQRQLEVFQRDRRTAHRGRARNRRRHRRRAALASRPRRMRRDRRRRSTVTSPAHDVVALAGGEFLMGSDRHYPEEAPAHRVHVDPFAIDRCTVTNEQFRSFVDATGYRTVAERPLDPADFPGAPAGNLVPGSLVFTPTPRSRRPPPPQSMVGVDAGRVVADTGGSGLGCRGSARPPGRARHPRGCVGVRIVGRRPTGHRSRMGVRRSRGPRRGSLHVG